MQLYGDHKCKRPNLCLWLLSFASGLLEVIKLIIRIQVAKIGKHNIESSNVQDLELEICDNSRDQTVWPLP